MAYRMRMVAESDERAQRIYVESLRWRQADLGGKLDTVTRQIAAMTRDEADLKQQLRAVEQLLSVEGDATAPPRGTGTVKGGATTQVKSGNEVAPDADDPSVTFAQWSLKSRAIYTAAADALREAGVPLHYRMLAEQVQKRVALGGVDPGATLIAHLHRAQDVFPRVGRGVYGLQGMAPAATTGDAGTKPAKRRRRARRRTR